MPTLRLQDRVALVTGGNSGLGRAIAIGLRDAGARVAVGGRRADRNAEVQRALGEGCIAVALDVADEDSVRAAVETVVARMGRLDVLVHAAGIARQRSVMELEREEWDLVMATNLTGAFLCTKHAAPHMARQGGGKIIHVSSVYGLVAPSRGLQVAYTVSKHGLLGLVRANAVELAPLNIQVNAIAPGFALTEMTQELAGLPIEAAIASRTPSGTGLAVPQRFVGTCVFLASEDAAHLSGVCIPIDGGYLASDGLNRG